MFCTKCGKTNDDDALFCEFCGAKIEVQAPSEPIPAPVQLFCEKCGKPNEPDALFCGYCGAIFGEAAVEVKTAQAAVPVSEPAPVPAPTPAPSAIPKNPEKRKKVGIIAAIASAAAVIVAVIIIVLANRPSAPESNAQMKINGKDVPVEMALFDLNSDSPTLYFCGKNDSGAYICTVGLKLKPTSYSNYSASVTIAYSGKDTRTSNGSHQYAALSTETTEISVGKMKYGEIIEFAAEGATKPDAYKDFDGTLVFSINAAASFDSNASNIVAEWKKANIIPE